MLFVRIYEESEPEKEVKAGDQVPKSSQDESQSTVSPFLHVFAACPAFQQRFARKEHNFDPPSKALMKGGTKPRALLKHLQDTDEGRDKPRALL